MRFTLETRPAPHKKGRKHAQLSCYGAFEKGAPQSKHDLPPYRAPLRARVKNQERELKCPIFVNPETAVFLRPCVHPSARACAPIVIERNDGFSSWNATRSGPENRDF